MGNGELPQGQGFHFSHIALRVPDPDSSAAFYQDVLGLSLHETMADGTHRLGWGIGFHALELVEGEPGLDHFGFEVPDEELLERLAEAAGGKRIHPDGHHPAVYEIEDPDANRIELHGRIDRAGEHAADTARRPVRVQHLALATPDVDRLVSFYEQVLSLRVSDRMGEVFVWLRSDRDHHTVAIVRSATSRLDHYSYDLSDWDDFKHWSDELAKKDVPLLWGPGRHGPGNNLFLMFADLDGNRVELSAEMEKYWDDRASYVPRVWEPVPTTVNLWGPEASWRHEVTVSNSVEER